MNYNPKDPDGIRINKSKEYHRKLESLAEERKTKDQGKVRVKIPNTNLTVLLSKTKIKELKTQAKAIEKDYNYVLSMLYDKRFIAQQSKKNEEDRINMFLLKHGLSRDIVKKPKGELGNDMNRKVLEFISDLKKNNEDFTQEFIATKLGINRMRIQTAIYRY